MGHICHYDTPQNNYFRKQQLLHTKVLLFRPISGHLSPSPVHFIRGAYPRARLEAAVLQRFLYNLPESVQKNKHRQDF